MMFYLSKIYYNYIILCILKQKIVEFVKKILECISNSVLNNKTKV